MLKADPASYPDVNPLVRHDPAAEPSYAEITGPSTAVDDAGPAGDAAPGDPAAGLPAGRLLLGLGVLVLMLLVGATVAIVLARRRLSTAHLPAQLPN